MPAPIRDALTLLPRDVLAGFGLLTRLPIPFAKGRPAGAWAWPLVGLVVQGLALGLGWVALNLGLTVAVAAVLVLAAQMVLTGALHEDGLADCADGLFGGHDKARRLEIMKDSRIGSYGALALMLAVLARWAALAGLMTLGAWGVILAAGALSRAPMAVLMAVLPNARGSGLSAMVGAPPVLAAAAGAGLALVIALALAGGAGLLMAGAVGIVAVGAGLTARAKIGGQTGDVLGASAVLAEVAALAVMA
jgi:adenosylcobinamide-GDP ribazoletransferase